MLELSKETIRELPTVIKMTWDILPIWIVFICSLFMLMLSGIISILWMFKDGESKNGRR